MKSFFAQFCSSALAAIVAGWLITWYTKQPTRSIGNAERLKLVVFAAIPAWLVMLLVAIAVWVGMTAYLQRGRIRNLKKCVAEWEGNASKAVVSQLHVAWTPNQTLWCVGSIAGEPAMQIIGWAHFSQSDATESIILSRAYLEGTEGRLSLDIRVPARGVVNRQLQTFVIPVIGREGEPLTASLIIEDHKNRKYRLEPHTFRYAGAPIEAPTAPERNYWD